MTPEIDGKAFPKLAAKVTFNPLPADVVSENHSAFSATPDTLEADNQQQATLTLVLRDRQDKPVANIQPRLHFAG
ncbi:hypothetical protein, partial [Xenorhabdus entomophaga]|uniref:hypothetical protein n=1 Tax=Xenorhabdus entomophaga TaxID=3136257 RepID=UPI0030F410AC